MTTLSQEILDSAKRKAQHIYDDKYYHLTSEDAAIMWRSCLIDVLVEEIEELRKEIECKRGKKY